MRLSRLHAFVLATGLIAASPAAIAQDGKGPSLIAPKGPALLIPLLEPARGRMLFAAKGCVICHSVNRVGGTLGPALDATGSPPFINPFAFVARMWNGAAQMLALQDRDLGYRIALSGEELADLTAFANDRDEQRKFREDDIPEAIRKLMHMQKL